MMDSKIAIPIRVEEVSFRPEKQRRRSQQAARPKVPRGYESTQSILLTEPRIESIRRELQALLEVVQLESNGKPIEIDGLRIRDISNWADYPSSLSDIFWHLSSVCNYSCEFCYEKGNPEDFPIQSATRMASEEEIKTRLRYYDPGKRTGIFTVRTAINEPFVNKRALNYLKLMRKKNPSELISFVTNGSYLTEEVVKELAAIQPLFFNLSMYTTDEDVRQSVILDRHPKRAVEAVELLRKYEIPYMSNLVMWPTIPLSDMERTIDFMAENRATIVRVCLGGYSRFLEGDFPRFTPDEYWPVVVEEVERLRDSYPIPILVEPSSFIRSDTDAIIEGVIDGSPAQRAGLQRGDEICSVDDVVIESRMQVLSVLRNRLLSEGGSYRPPGVLGVTETINGSTKSTVQLKIRRHEKAFYIKLDRFDDKSMGTFPYNAIAHYHDFMYGMVITDCLRYSSLLSVRNIVLKRKSRKTLLLSSSMIEPMVQFMLKRTNAFKGLNVDIRVAKNEYFGGSINVGDLLVVSDFISAIRSYIVEIDSKPDLVLIPESPFSSSPWGRDLTGLPWTEIERKTGITVELIPCGSITF